MLNRFIPAALFIIFMVGAAHAAPQQSISDTELAKSLQDISNDHLGAALNGVNQVLRDNPNFRLAQVVKGDLLMAQAGKITTFGNVTNAPRDKIEDLRDEARVRLQRMEDESENKKTPRFVWQLDPSQKYALVVDTSSSTLYVYENINGEAKYVADYYVTIGKLGADKKFAGDQRTPIGVYFIKSELQKSELTDIYGAAAFPLSYPNEWDRKHDRTGEGIWLHGTPSDTYSRAPRASNGCVVLSNDNLEKLAPYLQVGITPVIITSKMLWETPQDDDDRASLMDDIEQWRKDWNSLNTNKYLTHYATDFSSENEDFASWARQKEMINSSKTWIKVNISDISIFTYPEHPNMVIVDFNQDYSSSNLNNRMKKRQYWIKQNDHWKILYEGAA